MSMTLVVIVNVILDSAILVAIVGSHAWAVTTAHRDHGVDVATGPSTSAVPPFDLDEVPQPVGEVAIL